MHGSMTAPPDPSTASTASELVQRLSQLRWWSGQPSLRTLRRLGGAKRTPDGDEVDALPSSTTSDLLAGRCLPRLPRMAVVETYVSACLLAANLPPEEIRGQVERWRQAWRALAPGDLLPAVPTVAPADGASSAGRDRELQQIDRMLDTLGPLGPGEAVSLLDRIRQHATVAAARSQSLRDGAAGMRLLFCHEHFAPGLPWTDLGALLPGWEIIPSSRDRFADHLDTVDAVCPCNGARLDAAALEAGSFGLVQQFGVGVDTVDVERAAELGVWVARLPGAATGNADSVAEMAILHLLALVKRLDDARSALRNGRWREPAGGTLAGRTALIVGLGAVGGAVAHRLRAFDLRLIGVRAHPERGGPPGLAEVAGPDRLHRLVEQADVVVCCALYDGTNAGMFDAAAFAAMRRGALFVNVARGALVDERALLAALDGGHLGGAGLDVFAREPTDPAAPLVQHPLVVATPHVAGISRLMFERSGPLFAANLQRWAQGATPHWAVNAPITRDRRRASG